MHKLGNNGITKDKILSDIYWLQSLVEGEHDSTISCMHMNMYVYI